MADINRIYIPALLTGTACLFSALILRQLSVQAASLPLPLCFQEACLGKAFGCNTICFILTAIIILCDGFRHISFLVLLFPALICRNCCLTSCCYHSCTAKHLLLPDFLCRIYYKTSHLLSTCIFHVQYLAASSSSSTSSDISS